MKKSILFLLFFTLPLFGYIIPKWYPNNQSNTIMAYGDGSTLEDAKLMALEDIKDQLAKRRTPWALSFIGIDDLEIQAQEILENRYFIKASFVNLTEQEKLESILKKQVFKTEDETNQYIIKTDFMEELHTKFGYFPNITLDTNQTQFITLLGHKIKLHTNIYEMFWVEQYDQDIMIDIKKSFNEDELYFIKTKTTLDGYLSLIQISEQNDVVVLLENQQNKSEIIFPDFRSSDGLQVETLKENQLDRFLTLGVVCMEKKDFSSFNNLFSTTIKFGNLGKLLDTIGDCRFTSIGSTVTEKSDK